jgi:hypothetical protein
VVLPPPEENHCRAWRLVLVPVPLVRSMPVPLVGVVDMIVVRDGDVPAALAMRVRVSFVSAVTGSNTLVCMVFVRAVQVTIVYVVDVILMRDGDVPTALTVGVVMAHVGLMFSCDRHRITLHVQASTHCDSFRWKATDAGLP